VVSGQEIHWEHTRELGSAGQDWVGSIELGAVRGRGGSKLFVGVMGFESGLHG